MINDPIRLKSGAKAVQSAHNYTKNALERTIHVALLNRVVVIIYSLIVQCQDTAIRNISIRCWIFDVQCSMFKIVFKLIPSRKSCFAIFTILFLCPVASLFAAEIGVDIDSGELKSLPITPHLSANDESDIKGLSHFGASLFIRKHSESSDRLLAALEKNPHSSRILAFLLKNFRDYDVPDSQLKTFVAIAKANPQALPLNVAALGLAGCFTPEKGSSIDLKRVLAEKCIAESDLNKFDKIQFALFANIVRTLSEIYLKQKEYDLGDKLFEKLFKNKKLFEHNIYLQQAVIFYTQAAKKADKSRRFLVLLPSRARLYADCKQEFLDILHSRSDKTDEMKEVLKHLSFLQKIELLDEAKKILLEQIAKQPSKLVLQVALAGLFNRQKKYALTNAIWQKLAKTKPKNKLFRLKLAQSAFSARLYKLAANNFDKILQSSDKKNLSIIFMSVLSQLQLGEPDLAWVLLKMLPKIERFAEIRAHVASVLGENKQAFKILSKLIFKSSRSPDRKLYFFWLALAVKAESPEAQLKCLKILKDNLDIKDIEVANSIGYTYADLNKNLTEAKELISYALSKKPERPEYLDSMAWVLFRMNELEQSAVYIEKAVSADGKYPNSIIADHAGDIFYALGDKEKALYYWNLALKIFSFDLDENKTIKKIKDING